MEEVYIQVPRRIYLEMLGEIEDLKEELEKKDALLSEPDSYDKFLIRRVNTLMVLLIIQLAI